MHDSTYPIGPTTIRSPRHRPILLTALLALKLLSGLGTLFIYIVSLSVPTNSFWHNYYRTPVSAALWAYILLTTAALAFTIGTWLWKKWGVYGLVAVSAISAILNGAVGRSPLVVLILILSVDVGSLIILTRPVWKQFK